MKKKNSPIPPVTINEEMLKNERFVQSGINKYKAAVTDFAVQVKDSAVKFAQIDNNDDEYEVTSAHVDSASKKSFFSAPHPHRGWCIFLQIIEYVCTGLIGAGVSNLETSWGLIVSFVAGGICVILLLVRKLRLEEN